MKKKMIRILFQGDEIDSQDYWYIHGACNNDEGRPGPNNNDYKDDEDSDYQYDRDNVTRRSPSEGSRRPSGRRTPCPPKNQLRFIKYLPHFQLH